MFCPKCGSQLPEGVSFCASCGTPLAGPAGTAAGTAARPAKSSNKMIIVIVLIALFAVAVPVIGIISAIAIPNLLNAIQRGKQKRSLSDLRSIGTAVESYQVDYGFVPQVQSLDEVRGLLEPTYIKAVPTQDAWLTGFKYEAWRESEGSDFLDSYAVASAAKDKRFEYPQFTDYAPGETKRFDCDIVFSNGEFVQYPEGSQN